MIVLFGQKVVVMAPVFSRFPTWAKQINNPRVDKSLNEIKYSFIFFKVT